MLATIFAKTFLIPKSSVKVFLTVTLSACSSSALIYTFNLLSVSFWASGSVDVFHYFPTLFKQFMPSGDIQLFHNIGTKTSISIRRVLLVLLPNFGRNLLLMLCFNSLSCFSLSVQDRTLTDTATARLLLRSLLQQHKTQPQTSHNTLIFSHCSFVARSDTCASIPQSCHASYSNTPSHFGEKCVYCTYVSPSMSYTSSVPHYKYLYSTHVTGRPNYTCVM